MSGPVIRGVILRINLVQNYSSKFGYSQCCLLSPTGGVNNITSNSVKFYENGYDENKGYGNS